MTQTSMSAPSVPQVSQMAANLIGSEIIKLAADINKRIQQGEQIYNFTIGDFDPQVFPIPEALKKRSYRRIAANRPITRPPMV